MKKRYIIELMVLGIFSLSLGALGPKIGESFGSSFLEGLIMGVTVIFIIELILWVNKFTSNLTERKKGSKPNWKESFKPTKRKFKISFWITFIWWFISVFFWISRSTRVLCSEGRCPYWFPSLLPNVCECSTFMSSINELFIVLAPGIFFYVIFSVIEHFE